MNRNIKSIFVCLVLSMCFCLSSCDDFLSTVPDNRTEITDEDAVAALLVSAYPQASFDLLGEYMSDNAGDLGPSYSPGAVWHEDLFKWEPFTEISLDSPNYLWIQNYAAIAVANQALQSIEELGDTEEYQALKGEALVCRAYSMFILTNVFCQHYNPNTASSQQGLPYPTEPETEVFVDYNRLTLQEVYDQMEEDLTTGLPLLADAVYDAPKFHFTVQSANAFASRFYLYKGDWEKCIEHSNIALGNDPSSLLRDWEDVYSQFAIAAFMEAYSDSEESANLLIAGCRSTWARKYTYDRYGITTDKRDEFMAYYEGVHPWDGGISSGSTKIETGTYAMQSMYTGMDLWFVPKYNEEFEYAYPGSSTGYLWIMQPLFTGEEVLLNRAEAYIMSGQKQLGVDDLELWIETHSIHGGTIDDSYLKDYFIDNPHPDLHPYFTMTEDQDMWVKAILEIRRREFIHDGLRWFDIRRYNFEITHTTFGGDEYVLAPDDSRRAVDIPQFATNNGIDQNGEQAYTDPDAEADYVKPDYEEFISITKYPELEIK